MSLLRKAFCWGLVQFLEFFRIKKALEEGFFLGFQLGFSVVCTMSL